MASDGPILVSGKTGQVARCLAEFGRLSGIHVFAAERNDMDITEPASIHRLSKAVLPRAMVNAAGYTAVDRAESETELAFAVNRDGAAHMAAVARGLGIPFIHISTDYVFDGRKPLSYREDDLPSPLNVYGHSKLAGEIAVADANPNALVVRTSWIYSAYGTNFVKTILRLARTHDLVRVVDDQFGAPTAAIDVADAILQIAMNMLQDGMQGRAGIYHLTALGDTTWHGLAAAVYADWASRGHRVPVLQAITTKDYPTPALRPANSRLDCTKIERAFGIRLPLWSASITQCLDHLAETKLC
jgi:dTDP-4-dehydrorhamnose reductase